MKVSAEALAWVDELDHVQLLDELARAGLAVDGDPANADPAPPEQDGPTYQLIPLGQAWLRIEADTGGRLLGSLIPDARYPEVSDGQPPIRFDDNSEDLDGWFSTRADIDASGRRWVSVLRRPERESYVALVYDAAADRPQRQVLMQGIYPDVSLVDDGNQVVFIEPDQVQRGGQRAVLARADNATFDSSRQVIACSANGGLGVHPCSVRRYFKLSHGIRSERVWDLVDSRQDPPHPISVPGSPTNPSLFDVALLDGRPVLVQLHNGDGAWTLLASDLDDGRILSSWACASGVGEARELSSGSGYALVRVSRDGTELLHHVPISGFTSGREALLSSHGLLDLRFNTVTPAVGFSATELVGGGAPGFWYFSPSGECRNDPATLPHRDGAQVRARREHYTAPDGYTIGLDLRWPAWAGDHFSGPVMVMLYGAYGLDLDLDSDPTLKQWLDRGIAVATPHVRGGGPPARHLAGTRSRRGSSLADAAAAIAYLRAGSGAVTATRIIALGASAGGFLAATTLHTCPSQVDVCVVVNGFVDPLTSLLQDDSPTAASDQDEWGDPLGNRQDLETLRAISPLENLNGDHRAEILVVVSGMDVRVNPRQGLKWTLGQRQLGSSVELWYDPQGAHDCWGAGMPRTALVDWVVAALQRRDAR